MPSWSSGFLRGRSQEGQLGHIVESGPGRSGSPVTVPRQSSFAGGFVISSSCCRATFQFLRWCFVFSGACGLNSRCAGLRLLLSDMERLTPRQKA
jgi:hypothetical protein